MIIHSGMLIEDACARLFRPLPLSRMLALPLILAGRLYKFLELGDFAAGTAASRRASAYFRHFSRR